MSTELTFREGRGVSSSQRMEFPFWRLVAAVTVGTLIANAMVWFAIAQRMEWESRAILEVLRAAEAASKKEDVIRQQVEAMGREERRSEVLAAQERSRDRREGRYMRSASAAISEGELACLAGTVAKREANGWQQEFDSDGTSIKCRTTR